MLPLANSTGGALAFLFWGRARSEQIARRRFLRRGCAVSGLIELEAENKLYASRGERSMSGMVRISHLSRILHCAVLSVRHMEPPTTHLVSWLSLSTSCARFVSTHSNSMQSGNIPARDRASPHRKPRLQPVWERVRMRLPVRWSQRWRDAAKSTPLFPTKTVPKHHSHCGAQALTTENLDEEVVP